jgi:hypothetical protein
VSGDRTRPVRQDARDLEILSDFALRALNRIRDELVDEKSPKRALETALTAISLVGDGLDGIADRRVRRVLRKKLGSP